MMDVITDITALPGHLSGAVLAIGNFDGVHKGHRALIGAAKEQARQHGLPCGILTFEPHPRSLFRPDDRPFRLTPFAVKARLLEECGIDFIVSLPFDWDFASQSAEAFTDTILTGALAPVHIVIGADFRFGQLRKGTPDTLRQAGFAVTVMDKLGDQAGAIYSSSAIRAHLRHGEIAEARALLGWDWYIEGIVVEGDKRGRELGYPTANVPLENTVHPGYGVYATFVQIEGEDMWRPAATNIGIRPMFELKIGQVEAHILDFDADIYGRTLRIRPVQKLRGEAKFDSLEALIAQIDSDCAQTRQILTASR